jgi:hypothetical protein
MKKKKIKKKIGKILLYTRRNNILWLTNKYKMWCMLKIQAFNSKLSIRAFKVDKTERNLQTRTHNTK